MEITFFAQYFRKYAN